MDSLVIQRSLTLLEDRYRELREMGEKRFQAWEAEKGALHQRLMAAEAVQSELTDVKASKQSLEGELQNSREEAELLILQLHQVQEELEHYFLRSRDLEAQISEVKAAKQSLEDELTRQADKLQWLRNQRKLLITMLRRQGETLTHLHALQNRITLPAVLAFDQLGGMRWLKGTRRHR